MQCVCVVHNWNAFDVSFGGILFLYLESKDEAKRWQSGLVECILFKLPTVGKQNRGNDRNGIKRRTHKKKGQNVIVKKTEWLENVDRECETTLRERYFEKSKCPTLI